MYKRRCTACVTGSFSMRADNPSGCTPCFCFHRSSQCHQAPYVWSQVCHLYITPVSVTKHPTCGHRYVICISLQSVSPSTLRVVTGMSFVYHSSQCHQAPYVWSQVCHLYITPVSVTKHPTCGHRYVICISLQSVSPSTLRVVTGMSFVYHSSQCHQAPYVWSQVCHLYITPVSVTKHPTCGHRYVICISLQSVSPSTLRVVTGMSFVYHSSQCHQAPYVWSQVCHLYITPVSVTKHPTCGHRYVICIPLQSVSPSTLRVVTGMSFVYHSSQCHQAPYVWSQVCHLYTTPVSVTKHPTCGHRYVICIPLQSVSPSTLRVVTGMSFVYHSSQCHQAPYVWSQVCHLYTTPVSVTKHPTCGHRYVICIPLQSVSPSTLHMVTGMSFVYHSSQCHQAPYIWSQVCHLYTTPVSVTKHPTCGHRYVICIPLQSVSPSTLRVVTGMSFVYPSSQCHQAPYIWSQVCHWYKLIFSGFCTCISFKHRFSVVKKGLISVTFSQWPVKPNMLSVYLQLPTRNLLNSNGVLFNGDVACTCVWVLVM